MCFIEKPLIPDSFIVFLSKHVLQKPQRLGKWLLMLESLANIGGHISHKPTILIMVDTILDLLPDIFS